MVFVIAEAGVNHNGSVSVAHQLIDLAKTSGADAVKFQTFNPAQVVSGGAATAPYQQAATGTDDQLAMLEALTLPRGSWSELVDHSRDSGIEFMSTPFDYSSLELLVGLGVRRLKIPSGEVTNHEFVRAVAGAGLPVIMSTGMSSLEEVRDAVAIALAAPSLSLLHCVSSYPAPIDEANLACIPVMSDVFGLEVGWSDHCPGPLTAIAAVALGATIIERHFTLDRSSVGPDHAASDGPEEFADYVQAVRLTAQARGDGRKVATQSELPTLAVARRSWHAVRSLRAGETLKVGDVAALRPATGISPAISIDGAVMCRDVAQGDAVQLDDLVGRGQGYE